MFRKRSSPSGGQGSGSESSGVGPPEAGAPGSPGAPGVGGGKGRPTPSRRAAEEARKARVKPTLDKREARRRERDVARSHRAKTMAGLRAGDERYLTSRDAGPVRGFVRDYIDSRRTVAEYFMYVLAIVLIATLTGNRQVVAWANMVWIFGLLYVFGELAILAALTRRAVKARFPNEPTKGLRFYAVMRAAQIRRFRLPRPRVKPGAKI